MRTVQPKLCACLPRDTLTVLTVPSNLTIFVKKTQLLLDIKGFFCTSKVFIHFVGNNIWLFLLPKSGSTASSMPSVDWARFNVGLSPSLQHISEINDAIKRLIITAVYKVFVLRLFIIIHYFHFHFHCL